MTNQEKFDLIQNVWKPSKKFVFLRLMSLWAEKGDFSTSISSNIVGLYTQNNSMDASAYRAFYLGTDQLTIHAAQIDCSQNLLSTGQVPHPGLSSMRTSQTFIKTVSQLCQNSLR